MAEQLIVSPKSIHLCAKDLSEWLDFQDEILKSYIALLKEIEKTSIKAGEVHRTIYELRTVVELIYSESCEFGPQIKSELERFLTRIDEIDLKIYGE